MYYIYSYGGMALASALMSFTGALALFLFGMVAARHLHSRMLTVVSRAPMRFFDTTPVGRILNRFSSDTNVVDSVSRHWCLVTNAHFKPLIFKKYIVKANITIGENMFLRKQQKTFTFFNDPGTLKK